MRINKDELIADVKEVANKIGNPPTRPQYLKFGNFGANTIKRHWGSWNKAMQEILGSTARVTPVSLSEKICNTCGKTFMQQNSKQKFCSRRCSAIQSNKTSPKRSKKKKCKSCSIPIFSQYTYCPKCIQERHDKTSKTKLIDLIGKKKDANRFSLIRQHAKRIMKEEIQKCSRCNYDKHVEVCHIKEIKLFDKNATVGEVNAKENLILLCPNCHWEMDHKK